MGGLRLLNSPCCTHLSWVGLEWGRLEPRELTARPGTDSKGCRNVTVHLGYIPLVRTLEISRWSTQSLGVTTKSWRQKGSSETSD